jgi:hypothetical protein
MERFLENTDDEMWLGNEDEERDASREERLKAVMDQVDRLGLSGEEREGQVGK